ncbi:calcium-binding protein [Paracoccus xiamenensis]|uniref:calcium-binding protein n=1 Tax=Paracoccus xiamenensis TaxID=2714901 RepID=UPI001407CFAA|nr:calcium-binding protein [Paracoccus xiamenensis]NHF73686.1 hypothetical protein [Paracoccus xiamenensis]
MVSQRPDYSDNITDLAIVDTAAGSILVSTSNLGSSLFYKLSDADKAAASLARANPLKFGTYYSSPRMEVVQRDGNDLIVYTGMQGSVNSGLQVFSSGKPGRFVPLFPTTQIPGDVVATKHFEIDGQGYMLFARDGVMGMSLFEMSDSARLRKVGEVKPMSGFAVDAEFVDLDVISVNGGTFGYAASSQGNMLAVFRLSDAGIALTGRIDAGNTIGISAPREVAAVATASGNYLIVTGAHSDSITVFRISSSGGLSLADHVVDSGSTRFQATTAMAVVEMQGRAFIFVGGGDDGISVMTLDGQGRLILLTSIEDTDALALANVSAIEARVIGDRIAVFVTSGTEIGITQFSFDPGNIGVSRVRSGNNRGRDGDDILVGVGGSSALSGGAGDDILVAREGVVHMRGGLGSDIFVPGHGASMVVIHDYDPRYDQLDLSELAFVRSIAQLQIVPTSTGALLTAGTVKVEIMTKNGTMLRPSDFTEQMFRLAHYVNDIDYADLVQPVSPHPGTPAAEPVQPGSSGRYEPPSAMPKLTPKADRQYGGSGSDTLHATSAGSYLSGRHGHDVLKGNNQQDLIYGGTGNDKIFGGNGADYIKGGGGNDVIYAQNGHDSVEGGAGHNVINGGSGDDRLRGHDLRDIISGAHGNDILWGGSGNDFLDGGPGSDLIYGGGGRDRILGGAGHDRLYGQTSGARIGGGGGNDMIVTAGTDNFVSAHSGNDTVTGGSGNDWVNLGSGDDQARGAGGSDTIEGGSGNDLIYGGSGSDRLVGEDGDDRIYGGGGNDKALRGGNGNDRVYGDAGNDAMWGDGGADFMDGGTGNDTMRGGAGRDHLVGGSGNDYLSGDADRDTITGGSGADLAYGGAGNDHIDGESGGDRLIGERGDDKLIGGAGSDTLDGGIGHDTLIGGDGYDRLTGGTGADVFVFITPSAGSMGELDTIFDFASGRDVIDLTPLPGVLVWRGAEAFTGQGDVEVRYGSIKGGGQMQIDIDGDRRADLRINIFGDAVSPFDLLF